jgi:hypothetical protein
LIFLAAGFVDTTAVDPHPPTALVTRYGAGTKDLIQLWYAMAAPGIPQFFRIVSDLVEYNLIFAPSMGENGIALRSENRLRLAMQLKGSSVKTTHERHDDLRIVVVPNNASFRSLSRDPGCTGFINTIYRLLFADGRFIRLKDCNCSSHSSSNGLKLWSAFHPC